MRLVDAARYFDKLVCADAFNSLSTFLGQMDVFPGALRDAITADRRLLSVDPSITLPARQVLTIGGEQWIVGMSESDFFLNDGIRTKYIIHRAGGAASLMTPAQALSTGGVSTYGAKVWLKDTHDAAATSAAEGFFNIYLPAPESVLQGDVVSLSGHLHVVRNSFLSAAGFLVAEADELPAGALAAGVYTPRVYTPATDALADGTGVAVNVLTLRWTDDYVMPQASAPKYVPGDIRALVTKAAVATPKANDKVTVNSVNYQVIGVLPERLCFGLHLRVIA